MPSTPPSPSVPTSPHSPSASFYDMSDEDEHEYSTVRSSHSSKGVKLLFCKSKV